MDFFTQQDESRRQSHRLVWRFIFANILIAGILTIAIQAVYLFTISGYAKSPAPRPQHTTILAATLGQLLALKPFLIISAVVFLIIGISAFLKFRSLASSGGAVATMLGGRKITHDSRNPLERRLMNIVDEMSIASGLPVPEVYVLPTQEGINAFASGPTPERSAVAVTRGALERLSRDELQGVIAHEFSHILHGDVRLNIRLAAYIYGLLILVDIGGIFTELSRGGITNESFKSRGKAFAPLLILGLVVVALGSLGRILSVLMSAAVSRNREYLADATAVQLTRNAAGLAGALKKIGGYTHGSCVNSRFAEGVSHFFLADYKALNFYEKFASTHPPLLDRIKKLEPGFTGELPDASMIPMQSVESENGVSFLQGGAGNLPTQSTMPTVAAVSSITAEHATVNAWMPPLAITNRLRKVRAPEVVIYAMLIGDNAVTRLKQLEIISQVMNTAEVEQESPILSKLDLNQKLSLLLMAIPTIQGASQERLIKARDIIRALVDADGQTTLYELLSVILVHFSLLQEGTFPFHSGSSSEPVLRYKTPLQIITSIFALCSGETHEEQNQAFEMGQRALALSFERLDLPQLGIDRLIWAFEQVRGAAPKVRKALMDSLLSISRSNHVISHYEEALLRLAAILLRMPLPEEITQ